jgi:hypothetical protein
MQKAHLTSNDCNQIKRFIFRAPPRSWAFTARATATASRSLWLCRCPESTSVRAEFTLARQKTREGSRKSRSDSTSSVNPLSDRWIPWVWLLTPVSGFIVLTEDIQSLKLSGAKMVRMIKIVFSIKQIVSDHYEDVKYSIKFCLTFYFTFILLY